MWSIICCFAYLVSIMIYHDAKKGRPSSSSSFFFLLSSFFSFLSSSDYVWKRLHVNFIVFHFISFHFILFIRFILSLCLSVSLQLWVSNSWNSWTTTAFSLISEQSPPRLLRSWTKPMSQIFPPLSPPHSWMNARSLLLLQGRHGFSFIDPPSLNTEIKLLSFSLSLSSSPTARQTNVFLLFFLFYPWYVVNWIDLPFS